MANQQWKGPNVPDALGDAMMESQEMGEEIEKNKEEAFADAIGDEFQEDDDRRDLLKKVNELITEQTENETKPIDDKMFAEMITDAILYYEKMKEAKYEKLKKETFGESMSDLELREMKRVLDNSDLYKSQLESGTNEGINPTKNTLDENMTSDNEWVKRGRLLEEEEG